MAALTIPTLVANYQKKQWVSGLQKGYATLGNVFKMAMATDGVDNITQTSLWQALPDCGGWRCSEHSGEDYSTFIAELSKYLKVQKTCGPIGDEEDSCFVKYKLLNGGYDGYENLLTHGNRLKIYSADGIVYYLRLNEGNYWPEFKLTLLGRIEIDVNGDNPPNQYGRDLFEVFVFENGKLIFPGTQEWVDTADMHHHWDDNRSNYTCDTSGTFISVSDYCGARIFEQGWKMDY